MSDQTMMPEHKPVAKPEPVETQSGAEVFVVHRDYRVVWEKDPPTDRRRHFFASIIDFCEYLKRKADPEKTEIFVEEGEIVADFCNEIAHTDLIRCGLSVDARFAPWVPAITGATKLSQGGFLRLLRQSGAILLPDVRGALMATLGALKVTTGEAFEMHIDESGVTRFAGASRNQEFSGRIPPSVALLTPIFDGVKVPVVLETLRSEADEAPAEAELELAEYTLECFIEMEVKNGQASFNLDCPEYDAQLLQARRDAANWVRHLLGEQWLVSMGTRRVDTVRTTDSTLGNGDGNHL